MNCSRMHTAHSSSHLLGRGVCLSACWDTPPPGPEPPRCGPEPPVWAWTPLGVGLDTHLARPPNLHPGPGPRHTPMDRMTDTCKNNLRKLCFQVVKIILRNLDIFVWTSGFQNSLAHAHFNMFVDEC